MSAAMFLVGILAYLCTLVEFSSTANIIHCAACRAIVNEIEYEISKVDPKKVLEIEGFRVDPNGNQKSKQIPYLRSETHLTEITESICGKMNNYALSTDKTTGVKSYVRTSSTDGEGVQLENISFSTELSDKLRNTCNNLIEEHDDSIMEYFREPHTDAKTEFCTEIADICQRQNDEAEEEEEYDEEESREEL